MLDVYTSATGTVSLADAVAVHHRCGVPCALADGEKRRDLLSFGSRRSATIVPADGSRRVLEPDRENPSSIIAGRDAPAGVENESKMGTGARWSAATGSFAHGRAPC